MKVTTQFPHHAYVTFGGFYTNLHVWSVSMRRHAASAWRLSASSKVLAVSMWRRAASVRGCARCGRVWPRSAGLWGENARRRGRNVPAQGTMPGRRGQKLCRSRPGRRRRGRDAACRRRLPGRRESHALMQSGYFVLHSSARVSACLRTRPCRHPPKSSDPWRR